MRMEPRDHLVSPSLKQLAEKLRQGRRDALDNFWEAASRQGAPLIETIPGDCDHRWVTFLCRGTAETKNVVTIASFTGSDPVSGQMRLLADSDVWYRTWRLPAEARTCYQISENDPLIPLLYVEDFRARTSGWRPDVLNRKKLSFPPDPESGFMGRELSVLELPQAPKMLWGTPLPPAERGSLELHRLPSDRLGNTRRIWVHRNRPENVPGKTSPGLLLALDGLALVSALQFPIMLDNMYRANKICPFVTLFIDALDQSVRFREFACHAPFSEFLANELVPWACETFGLEHDPDHTILYGPSHGGLAATFAALAFPRVFGHALIHSGSFWWSPEYPNDHEWLAQLVAASDLAPVDFWIEAGKLERWRLRDGDPTVLNASRHMRDVLRARGYSVQYREFTGGHDYNCWQTSFPEAIMALAPPRG